MKIENERFTLSSNIKFGDFTSSSGSLRNSLVPRAFLHFLREKGPGNEVAYARDDTAAKVNVV